MTAGCVRERRGRSLPDHQPHPGGRVGMGKGRHLGGQHLVSAHVGKGEDTGLHQERQWLAVPGHGQSAAAPNGARPHGRDLVEGPVARGRLAGQDSDTRRASTSAVVAAVPLFEATARPTATSAGRSGSALPTRVQSRAGGGARGGDGATSAGEAQPLPGAHARVRPAVVAPPRRSAALQLSRPSPYRPGG